MNYRTSNYPCRTFLCKKSDNQTQLTPNTHTRLRSEKLQNIILQKLIFKIYNFKFCLPKNNYNIIFYFNNSVKSYIYYKIIDFFVIIIAMVSY